MGELFRIVLGEASSSVFQVVNYLKVKDKTVNLRLQEKLPVDDIISKILIGIQRIDDKIYLKIGQSCLA